MYLCRYYEHVRKYLKYPERAGSAIKAERVYIMKHLLRLPGQVPLSSQYLHVFF